MDVGLRRGGWLQMDDGADVAFVDSHAEGAGAAEDGGLVGEEPLLGGGLFLLGEAGVVEPHLVGWKYVPEKAGDGLGRGPSAAEYNEGTLLLGGKLQGRLFLDAGIHHGIVDVLAVRGAFHKVGGLAAKEDFCDTLEHWG